MRLYAQSHHNGAVGHYAGLLPELEGVLREAGELAQDSRRTLSRKLKKDGSIVTNADVRVEEFLRARLTQLLPGSAIWGEEFGHALEEDRGLWLVDPIDGTTNFAYLSPLWGVSVALMINGDVVLGGVNLADLGELYLCAKGHGVTCNGRGLQPIPPGPVREEEPVSFGRTVARNSDKPPGKLRNSGAFVIDGAFTANQRIRGLIGVNEKLYDMAACALFVLELGGEMRYADGTPLAFSDLQKDEKIKKPWILFPKDSGFLMSWTP